MTTIDASTQRGVVGRTTTTADHSNPTLVACALAWQGNPLAGMDMCPNRAQRIVASVFACNTVADILSWRTQTPSSEHRLRWRAGVRWARDLLTIPGAETLSDEGTGDEADATPGRLSGTAEVPTP